MLKAATVAILLGLISPLTQAADCVAEDAETTLTSTISRETFPGPGGRSPELPARAAPSQS